MPWTRTVTSHVENARDANSEHQVLRSQPDETLTVQEWIQMRFYEAMDMERDAAAHESATHFF